MILKTGTTITSAQAKKLCTLYDGNKVSFNGNFPECLDLENIQDSDKFNVLINYGNSVHLLLNDAKFRADICLSKLHGNCSTLKENGVMTTPQWHALAKI